MTWLILILVSVGDCMLLYIAVRLAWAIMEDRPPKPPMPRYTGPPMPPSRLTLWRRRFWRWLRRNRRELAKQ